MRQVAAIAIVLSSPSLLCGDVRDRIAEWSARCATMPVVEVEWRRSVPHFDSADGPQSDVVVSDVRSLFRWPDCYRQDSTPVVFEGMNARLAEVHTATGWRSEVLDPAGRRLQLEMSEIKELWPYGMPLADPRIVSKKLIDAPILLGHWIAREPDELVQTEVLSEDTRGATLRFPSRGITVSFGGLDEPDLFVRRIEWWEGAGPPSMIAQYSDVRAIPGGQVRMGFERTIEAPRSQRRVVLTEQLRSAMVSRNVDDTEFDVAKTVVAAKIPTIVVQAGRTPRPEALAPPAEPPSLKRHPVEGPSSGRAAWIVWSAASVVMIGVTAIILVRRLRRPA